MRHLVFLLTIFSSIYFGAGFAKASPTSSQTIQDHPHQYPTVPHLTAAPLDEFRQNILTEIIDAKISGTDIPEALDKICPHEITRQSEIPKSVAEAVVVTQSDFAVETKFSYTGNSSKTHIESYSILMDFEPHRILLRHSNPRFKSQKMGFYVPFPRDFVRPIRLEGTLSADMLVLIAPTRECGVQAIAMCPRQYAYRDKLLLSPYQLVGARAFLDAKADGILSVSEEGHHKVMTSIRASENIPLPSRWSTYKSGDHLLESTISIKDTVASTFQPINSLPVQMAVESRVDMGTPNKSLRTAFNRTTIEMSEMMISDRDELRVGKSNLHVEGGKCFLITARTNAQL